jgi:hypothetical protein
MWMRRSDIEEAAPGAVWARVGVVLTAVVSVALALLAVLLTVRGHMLGR